MSVANLVLWCSGGRQLRAGEDSVVPSHLRSTPTYGDDVELGWGEVAATAKGEAMGCEKGIRWR